MQARTKPLQIIEGENDKNLTTSESFKKPEEKADCQLISADEVPKLVSLLQNEAKVI